MIKSVKPTKRQADVIRMIRAFIKKRGYAPTVREIGAVLEITSGAVQGHIDALAKKGLVSRDPGLARSLRLNGATDVH